MAAIEEPGIQLALWGEVRSARRSPRLADALATPHFYCSGHFIVLPTAMKLVKYLRNLGYGSRREVAHLVERGRVTREDGSALNDRDAFTHEDVRVDGELLDPTPGVVLMLHKPLGYVCSTEDAGPVIYDLLQPRFRKRLPIISPIGRLDRDTSGLLLLTDDGQLSNRIRSPRRHLPKIYEARLATPLRGDEATLFASGTMVLERESSPLRPATLEVIDELNVRLTLVEGRYHQVRRMFGAVGNRVESLHRCAIGGLDLGTLPPGKWREIGATDLALLFSDGTSLSQD